MLNVAFAYRLFLLASIVSLAFLAGWKVANWQEDSAKLVQVTKANQKAQAALDDAAVSATMLNEKLTSLKDEAVSSIRALANETQKPIFHTPCVTDHYIGLLNTHIGNVERTLSSKRDDAVQDKPTEIKRTNRP